MKKADVLIVGGGPAGASCAQELIKAGYHVIVLDKSSFPRDKLCAGWVPPSLFTRIGVKPEEYPHGLRTYRMLHFRVKGFPLPVPTRQYALRRVEFDHWLLQRSGAEVYKHNVRRIERREKGTPEFVIDGSFAAPCLVGAGGTGCPVARYAEKANDAGENWFINENGGVGRRKKETDRLIVTMEEEFYYPERKEACYLRFFDNGLLGYSWYFPKADGYLTIGIGGKQSELRKRGETIRDHWHAFIRSLWKKGLVRDHDFAPSGHSYYLRGPKLSSGESIDTDRGKRKGDRGEPVQEQRDGAEGLYVAGDAAGLATVDMGEGIEPAVHSGLLAARAVIENKPYSTEPIKRRSLPEIVF
ncbi:MAG: NAD(P)/FAD-dependent oxidoreductase [Spirochaetia bacterium]